MYHQLTVEQCDKLREFALKSYVETTGIKENSLQYAMAEEMIIATICTIREYEAMIKKNHK